MLTKNDFAERRKRLMDQMGPDSVAILMAPVEQVRNGDTHFAYRPNSDFYYLTCFAEPEAVMVLRPHADEEYILFNRPRDLTAETWNGKRAGQTGACEIFGANKSYVIEKFFEMFPQLIQGKKKLYYDTGNSLEHDERIFQILNKGRQGKRNVTAYPDEVVTLAPLIHELRLFKSEAEINSMRKAAEISAEAHLSAMQKCRPNMKEYELEAELLYVFTKNGARQVAYPSIVGSGENTCILHYIENNQTIKADALVLIDAGCEYQMYASDITRTFPASGKFNNEQRKIYEIVLEAQKIGIEQIKPGNNWEITQQVIAKYISQELIKLNLIEGPLEKALYDKSYQKFYLHQPGHWLGLDVHDVGNYLVKGKPRPFAAGMVLTMEPGLYIAESPEIDSKWWNIGVRIEDDVLVTENGNEVLSAGLIKEVSEIEEVMKKR